MEMTMKHARISVVGLAMLLGSCATAPKPVPVTPATTPPAPAINPFADAPLFVNPEYTKSVQALITAHPGEAEMLKKLSVIPTAIWLSWIADTKDVPRYLDLALQQQKAGGKPVITTFVVYDLPNRDCNAAASAGELPASPEGEARYQRDYIDAIAAAFAAHPDQRIAAILEPDSVGNLITNLENPKCQAAEGIYKRGIAYAIAKLSLPNVSLYLDAAHAGWLGWPKNLVKTAPMFKEILTDGRRPRPHPRLRHRRVELQPGQGSDQPEARPARRAQRRARLHRRPQQGARGRGHHRQGLRHRHQPRRQGAHPHLDRQLVQHQGRRPASARRPRRRRSSTRTCGSSRPASPTASPTPRRRASIGTAPPTTRPPARPRPARCSTRM